ncbi:40S ribosomal protein S4-like [Salvia miltiorrhiza]|uniref:40S ribosomal protein S4-like n=1 Tax=Salvia miltiorrhiza TaxID=226208 RepID=UPI0025AD00F9|nr:40S ribosomal protein S4-like [Salvia miltiorrhiza]
MDYQGWSAAAAAHLPFIPLSHFRQRTTKEEPALQICSDCASHLCESSERSGIPYINTFDGMTIRYPDPLIKANDTIKLDLDSNKIVDFIKYDVGNVVMVIGGRNRGRVGVIKNREKHKGSFETLHIEDASGHEFATRSGNVFTIGKGTKPWISLPKGKGIKLTIIEEARKRIQLSLLL